MSSPQSFYEDKLALYRAQTGIVQKRMVGIAWLRLFVFAGLVFGVYRLVTTGFPRDLIWLNGCVFAAFIGLVALTLRLRDRRSLLEKLSYVNANELAILKNDTNGFDDGRELLTHDGYLDDLDIFGPRSLFHLLNRTTTSHGRERLSVLLKETSLSPDEISNCQEAVRVLSGQPEARQLLTAQGLLNEEKEGNLHSLAGWLEEPPVLLKKQWVLISRWVLIVYNLAGVGIWIVTGNHQPLVAGVLAGWGLTGLFSGYIAKQHVQLGKKTGVLEQYQSILSVFGTVDAGQSITLQSMKAERGLSWKAIQELARLSTFFDQSLNFLVGFFLNSIFLYNLNCVIALEKWKKAHKQLFPAWIGLVGNIECLNSLATFAFNNPDYTYPAPLPKSSRSSAGDALSREDSSNYGEPSSPGHPFIEALEMAHPLIAANDRVPNDFSIGRNERLILVTGSNMSGKTTFLRTAGVNLLLAQCGAPVCARRFSFTPMRILSSLRVSDSLQEHTSYFMAELKKLRQIIDRLQNGAPALVLVDEILRGTNSEDKTHGSEQFIHKLLQHNSLSLFATHDLSLSSLEQETAGVVSNYCFESVIEQGELHFNYRYQRGVAKNRNASFLMEKMGII